MTKTEQNLHAQKSGRRFPVVRTARICGIGLFCVALVFRILSRFNAPFFHDAAGFQVFVSSLLWVSFVFNLSSCLIDEELSFPFIPSLFLAVLFFLWLGGTTWFSSYLFASKVAFWTWSGYIATFLMVLLIGIHHRYLLMYPLSTALASIGIQLFYGIYQYVFLYPNLARQIQQSPSIMEGVVSESMRSEFRSRVLGGEPSGTLVSPNSLAALCAIGLLFGAGCLLLACFRTWNTDQSDPRSSPSYLLLSTGALLSGASLVLLYLTGSKGTAVALVCALIPPMLFLVIKKFGGYGLFGVSGGMVVLSIGLVYGFWSGNWGEKLGAQKSLQFRAWYASAAVDVMKTRPLTGVGLHNFQFYYPKYKPACAEETSRAHNDYLDLAAETGLPGGILVLLFWFVLLFRLLSRLFQGGSMNEPGERDPPTLPMWIGFPELFGALGSLAVLLLFGLNAGPLFRSTESIVLMFGTVVLWIILFAGFLKLFTRSDIPDGTTPAQSLVLLSALLFYLVHGVVDFDIYVPAVGTVLFFISALVVIPEGDTDCYHFRPSRIAGLGISLFLFLAMVPLLLYSNRLMKSGFRLRALRSRMNDQPSEQTLKTYRDILSNRPGDTLLLNEISSFYHSRYCRNGKQQGRDDLSNHGEAFRTDLQFLNRSIHRNRADWSSYSQKAEHIQDHRKVLEQIPGIPASDDRNEELRSTVSETARFQALKQAVDQYPTRARTLYKFGRLLLKRDETARAADVFQKALRIHRCQNLNRMKLPEKAQTFAENWLQKHQSG